MVWVFSSLKQIIIVNKRCDKKGCSKVSFSLLYYTENHQRYTLDYKMRCGVVLCAFVGLLSVVQGANILGLFPVSGQSHNHFFSALTTELSRRGHNLTVLTAFPSKFRLPNYREIPVNMIEEFKSNFSPFKHTGKSTISKLSEMLNLFLKLCPSVLQSDQVS